MFFRIRIPEFGSRGPNPGEIQEPRSIHTDLPISPHGLSLCICGKRTITQQIQSGVILKAAYKQNNIQTFRSDSHIMVGYFYFAGLRYKKHVNYVMGYTCLIHRIVDISSYFLIIAVRRCISLWKCKGVRIGWNFSYVSPTLNLLTPM